MNFIDFIPNITKFQLPSNPLILPPMNQWTSNDLHPIRGAAQIQELINNGRAGFTRSIPFQYFDPMLLDIHYWSSEDALFFIVYKQNSELKMNNERSAGVTCISCGEFEGEASIEQKMAYCFALNNLIAKICERVAIRDTAFLTTGFGNLYLSPRRASHILSMLKKPPPPKKWWQL